MTNANQLFKAAGIVTLKGNTKVRFTDEYVRRSKQFSKEGATRNDLVELPNDMTKLEALAYLKTHEKFQNPGDMMLIEDATKYRQLIADKASGAIPKRGRGRPRKNPAVVKTGIEHMIDYIMSSAEKKEVTAEDVLVAAGIKV